MIKFKLTVPLAVTRTHKIENDAGMGHPPSASGTRGHNLPVPVVPVYRYDSTSDVRFLTPEFEKLPRDSLREAA